MNQNTHPPQDVEMTFVDHLEALRWHLVRGLSVTGILAIIAFFNRTIIFDGIILAPKNLNFASYRWACEFSNFIGLGDRLCLKTITFEVFNLQMAGQFTQHIIVSFIAGIIVGFPFLAWEMWRFLKPALSAKERTYASGIVFYTSLLFFMGVLFGYYVICPVSIQFLGSYHVSAEVANQINLTSYISTITMITLATSIIFELPILVYFLTKIGLITPDLMRQYRKHALIIILIVSAVITPPDIASQILLAIPFFILYEVSIKISKVVYLRQLKVEK
jgi:sec-independent protein translocase protein TatC